MAAARCPPRSEPTKSHTVECALPCVVRQVDAPAIENCREGLPSALFLEHVFDRLSPLVVRGQFSAFLLQPVMETVHQGVGKVPGGREGVHRDPARATPEFIRRFQINVLPNGFHRIRRFGLLASSARKTNITKIRALLCVQRSEHATPPRLKAEIIPLILREPCLCRGGPMRIIEISRSGQKPMSRAPPR